MTVSPFETSPRGRARSARGSSWALVGLMAMLVVTGCGERVSITGTAGATRSGTGSTGGSTGSIDARLVGRWSRTVLFQDAAGAVHASRTSWRFGSDASASRAVVSSNLTFGFVDSVVTSARWRIDGGRIVITFLPAGSGDARFDYRLDGPTLILGGLPFERQ